MAVPKRRRSKTVRLQRQTHDALTPVTLTTCPNCGAKVKPHHVCPKCGQYAGDVIVAKKEESDN